MCTSLAVGLAFFIAQPLAAEAGCDSTVRACACTCNVHTLGQFLSSDLLSSLLSSPLLPHSRAPQAHVHACASHAYVTVAQIRLCGARRVCS